MCSDCSRTPLLDSIRCGDKKCHKYCHRCLWRWLQLRSWHNHCGRNKRMKWTKRGEKIKCKFAGHHLGHFGSHVLNAPIKWSTYLVSGQHFARLFFFPDTALYPSSHISSFEEVQKPDSTQTFWSVGFLLSYFIRQSSSSAHASELFVQSVHSPAQRFAAEAPEAPVQLVVTLHAFLQSHWNSHVMSSVVDPPGLSCGCKRQYSSLHTHLQSTHVAPNGNGSPVSGSAIPKPPQSSSLRFQNIDKPKHERRREGVWEKHWCDLASVWCPNKDVGHGERQMNMIWFSSLFYLEHSIRLPMSRSVKQYEGALAQSVLQDEQPASLLSQAAQSKSRLSFQCQCMSKRT